ncbi:beta-glucuronosyltransferase GlcAT14B-like [Phalaenopsis equestris]|uniref:beta-glucuronosyltransferase GlcAT14B-like n=1 Tax=Phalaenopsis equestris TaxID=78828 RepID=UPI0009E1CDB6|nr:beta-glucuronosyltransferase GlcAT14B-like [Phalaenopsis equestris]
MNPNNFETESPGEILFMKGRICLPLTPVEKRWSLPLFLTSLLLTFLLLTSFNMGLLTSLSTLFSFQLHQSYHSAIAVDTTPLEDIPRLAYLISGSKGDINRLWRTLLALYHPRNVYVLHLDLESPKHDREELITRTANHSLFAKVGNVHVIKKANMVSYRGPTMVATTLHACAVLLKKSKDWDWFINLSASDYPLVTQDDLLFTLSKLPRNLNFIDHTSNLRWKEEHRARPLIVDPGLYRTTKSDVFWAMRRRELPNAFKLFTGSAWMTLSRDFVEFCIWGWDNLPRTLLMYYTNFISSPEGYFHTVICNAPEFNTTVVNHDLHYISWDSPPKQHPHSLSLNDAARMIGSNAPFARKFRKDDPVLDKIDLEQLRRRKDWVTPGGWCSGSPPCSDVGEDWRLEPGPGSERLAKLMDRIVRSEYEFKMKQCR